VRTALLVAALLASVAAGAAEPRLEVAFTWDDLPLNGALPLGAKQSDFARDTIKVLRKHRIPPSYGFINAGKLERNPDGARALQIWVDGGHPLANHTYSHIDFSRSSVDDFQREILRNEPALTLLMPPGRFRDRHDWRWFRYPYLHEGDTLEKRQAVRAFLAANGYRIAQVTLDFEDYLWNSAHAACVMKKDDASIAWLRQSYLDAAREFTRLQVAQSRQIFGRDIPHVMLLHLGSFSSHILGDLFKLLREEGFEFVTLEQVQRDAAYDYDPAYVHVQTGTFLNQGLAAKGLPWPQNAPSKPRLELSTICR
jgi:peptidoglycan/xylan/chitin deacetylase (PgdA/CDA1 family)